MKISEYSFGTNYSSKLYQALNDHICHSDNPKYTDILELSDGDRKDLLIMFHRVVQKSINDAINEEDKFNLPKFVSLKIKEGNRLAYKLRDEIAMKHGYTSYKVVKSADRVKMREELTQRIREEKLKLKKNKVNPKSSPKVTFNMKNIKKIG